jgi:tetratricopeptide (TPR) repeat protein
MAACTAAVLAVTNVKAPAARHRAWAATMLAMLMLPVWTAWGPSLTAPVLPAGEPAVPAPARIRETLSPVILPHTTAAPNPPLTRTELPPESPRPDAESFFLPLYLAGVAIMIARLARGTLLARRLRHEARAEHDFYTSADCAAPVTVGWLQPALLLPESWHTWPAARLDAVLIHEREHARRRDPLVQWLALLNRSIFWFHPLAWWLERKLAALAEEACDAAVLSRGHSPHEYAQHLLEIARSVAAQGTRIRHSGACGFSAGGMRRRLRRIVEFRPAKVSRLRATVTGTLCLALLALCLACSIGSKPAARKSYASMAEQDRRAQTELRLRSDKWNEEETLLRDAALGLTPDRAKLREAELKNNPGQPYRVRELVMYYQSAKNVKALNDLTLWFIANHPDVRQDWGTRPAWDEVWDRDGYAGAREAWLAALKQPGHNANFYMNAGEYLSGNDNEQAEQIFREGQRKFPDAGLHWEVFLARHYAWALTGSKGQLPGDRSSAGDNEIASADPYANGVRRRLLASSDSELLDRVVEQLQGNKANADFTKSLIERMLALDPNSRMAHLRLQHMRLQNVMQRANADLQSLNDSDRMLWMESQLAHGRKVAGEAMAKDLLTLAARNPKDPSFGAATLIAHLILGEVALKRGDKPAAIRHLNAAGNAPPDESLRYMQINMTFPRQLVDAGEREQVAAFLDRCAKFGEFDKHLATWAAQIRKGENPRLFPNFDPLAKNFGFIRLTKLFVAPYFGVT